MCQRFQLLQSQDTLQLDIDLLDSLVKKALLCWPVLVPQMVGEPTLPGEVKVNVSVRQSPIDGPAIKLVK